jgi:hypothetical protein
MTAFNPVNDFETALVDARAGNLSVQELLHEFAHTQVAVLSATEVRKDGSGFQPLLFPKEGVPMLACFTDKSRVGEYADIAPYALTMTGRDLLRRMPPDHGLVVNPGSSVGFDMPPEGIAQLVRELG